LRRIFPEICYQFPDVVLTARIVGILNKLVAFLFQPILPLLKCKTREFGNVHPESVKLGEYGIKSPVIYTGNPPVAVNIGSYCLYNFGSLLLGVTASTFGPMVALRMNSLAGFFALVCIAFLLPAIHGRTKTADASVAHPENE